MIKVIENSQGQSNIKEYPKLMIGADTGKIMLIVSKDVGYILKEGEGSSCAVGDYFTTTDVCIGMLDYNKPITIQNV